MPLQNPPALVIEGPFNGSVILCQEGDGFHLNIGYRTDDPWSGPGAGDGSLLYRKVVRILGDEYHFFADKRCTNEKIIELLIEGYKPALSKFKYTPKFIGGPRDGEPCFGVEHAGYVKLVLGDKSRYLQAVIYKPSEIPDRESVSMLVGGYMRVCVRE